MFVMRRMRRSDLRCVMEVQAVAYDARYHEDEVVFAEKLDLFPYGCWIGEMDSGVVGYLFSHPWQIGAPPELNAQLGELPKQPDCYYIHDVAVRPSFQGRGIGRELACKAKTLAAEYEWSRIALVSIQDSQGFWGKSGFECVTDLSPTMSEKIASYGSEACFMICSVT